MTKRQFTLRYLFAMLGPIAVSLTLIRFGVVGDLFEVLVATWLIISTTVVLGGFLVAGLRGSLVWLICLAVVYLLFAYFVWPIEFDVRWLRHAATVAGTLLLSATICIAAIYTIGPTPVFIVLSLVALVAMFLPSSSTMGTLIYVPPDLPDPNYYTTTYGLGRPLPWVTWYKSWNEAKGIQNSEFGAVAVGNLVAHILAICVPLLMIFFTRECWRD